MSGFTPPFWARNPHVQTILPLLTKVAKPQLRRQRLTLCDGDFIDLDWCGVPTEGQPIVLLIHGLEGSSDSHYIRRMLATCQQLNICALVHHHRSCSGAANLLARSYHSGETGDLSATLSWLQYHYPSSPIWAVGYSLGGNMLAKYLGERSNHSLVQRAAVISAPLQLAACSRRLERGFSRLYQRHLLRQLQAKTAAKLASPKTRAQMPLDDTTLASLNTFYRFDHHVTAPLHGFSSAKSYYQYASALPWLIQIAVPTLILHSRDDPFMTQAVIPSPQQLSKHILYELQPYGGHVGFIDSGLPWRPGYYLERRIIEFLTGAPKC
ncbi:alpha/beta hydrolase [Shewanella sp. NFH-SH190041]|uniref:hydrolase n=1 Tax=Shewanella sp. NFH-SH190041 TaxID=2950245 RepID=UPI0021C3C4CD|nr:hydrolase [Shewanella sp. NFH-SH190041]BDM65729.1 alpha/beta hydrolase [Shewanella sp. NFH-SH190041]